MVQVAPPVNKNITIYREYNALHTGDLWSGAQMETPPFVRQKFEELEILHKISLPAMTPILAIQTCIQDQDTLWPALKFNIEPLAASSNHIRSAELRVFMEPGNNYGIQAAPLIRVYQIVSNRALSEPDSHRLLAVTYPTISHNSPGQWLTFNVLTAVQDWVNNVRENLGFLLTDMQPSISHQPLLVITYMAQQGTQNSVPFEVQSGSSVSSYDEAMTSSSSCTLTSLRLNLTHWGLLGPQSLDMGQCGGACGTSELLASHHMSVHTALTSILATQNSSLKQPCCVPAEYRPAPVLYRAENGNFIIKVLSNFVVTSCMCR